jgi:hypothetical protein
VEHEWITNIETAVQEYSGQLFQESLKEEIAAQLHATPPKGTRQ